MNSQETKDVSATVQLNYTVPADATKTDIEQSIHADLCRLLDADGRTGAACWAVTVEKVSQ